MAAVVNPGSAATPKRPPHPNSIVNEVAWIPVEADQTMALLELFVEHFGHRTGGAMLAWLQMKLAGIPDPTGPNTRSKFRQNLEKLEELGITPPAPGSGRRVEAAVAVLSETGKGPVAEKAAEVAQARALYSQRGAAAAGLPLVVTVLAVVAAAVARGGSLGAGLALAVPDITSTVGEDGPVEPGGDEAAGQGLAPVVPMRRRVRIDDSVDARGDAYRAVA